MKSEVLAIINIIKKNYKNYLLQQTELPKFIQYIVNFFKNLRSELSVLLPLLIAIQFGLPNMVPI